MSRGNLRAVLFESEVAGVEQMDLRIAYVAPKSFSSRRREDRVVLAPDGEHGRLMIAEVLVPCRIERRVRPVVVGERELDGSVPGSVEACDGSVPGSVEACLVVSLRIRANIFRVARSLKVLILRRL